MEVEVEVEAVESVGSVGDSISGREVRSTRLVHGSWCTEAANGKYTTAATEVQGTPYIVPACLR